jgi:hypothetical protein
MLARVTGRSITSLLATIPSLGAIAGGSLDERLHLGFTNWRSACRASGLSASSLLHFTLELLPLAVIGMLAGGVLLLCIGFFVRTRHDAARACGAAHLGCAVAMPLSVLLCVTLPVGAMLVIDFVLAAGVAAIAWRAFPRPAKRVPAHP